LYFLEHTFKQKESIVVTDSFISCEAIGVDRVLVRDLLLSLYAELRIRNIHRAIDILEGRWSKSEINEIEGINNPQSFCVKLY